MRRLALLLLAAPALSTAAFADPTLTFQDGTFLPARLEVTGADSVTITLINAGAEPVEFESHALRKEKVLAPGASSFIVLRGVGPGEYDFFDDFHPDAAKGVLVVK